MTEFRMSKAIFLAATVLLLLPCCSGKKDAVPIPQSGGSTAGGTPVGASSPGAQPLAIDGGKGSLLMVPSTPSRIDPPRAVVSLPPGTVPVIIWRINGREGPRGDRLDPSQFEKGDRVQAVVRWEEGGTTKTAASREKAIGNSPPVIGEVTLDRKNPTAGGTVHAVASAGDLDRDKVTLLYRWYVDDKEVSATGADFTLDGVRKGSWIQYRVEARDEDSPGPWKFSPKYQVVNSLPVVRSVLPGSVPADRLFVYRIVAEDPDGDTLTYSLAKSPPGVVLNSAVLEWRIPEDYIGRNADIRVDISDGDGGITQLDINMTVRRN